MEKLPLAPALLRLISEGRFFKVVFAWLLRLGALGAVLAGVWLSIGLWKDGGSSTQAVFAQLVFQIALAAAFYLAAHLAWLRAQDVAAMPQVGGDVILPLARLIMRLGGEVYASLLAVLSVGGALLIWISAGDAQAGLAGLGPLLPMAGGDPFPAGLNLLAVGLASAALGLLGAYTASEVLALLCSIERNTRSGGQA
ncbi:MAG TPA: hypothetical protein VF804_04130 [Holophagaceae bacterium]